MVTSGNATAHTTGFRERIRFFPITIFAVVMGLAGYAIILNKWYHFRWLPYSAYMGLTAAVTGLFFLFLLLYGLKAMAAPEEVKADFDHKVRMNFFPTISISLLLLSIAYAGAWPAASAAFWLLGTTAHFFLMLHIVSRWIRHEFEIRHFNPAWYIPVVGNVLIPVMGVDFAPPQISFFFLSAGVFFWLMLSAITLYRLIFHSPIPRKLTPTLLILIAPPAVGFVAYMRLLMSWDPASRMLLMLAYFLTVLILFLAPVFRELPFYLSWWAFTFPLDALTIASTVAYIITRRPFYAAAAWASFIGVSAVIAMVLGRTIAAAWRREICIKEE